MSAHTSMFCQQNFGSKAGHASLPWLFHVFCFPIALCEREFPQGSLWGVAFALHGALLAQDGLGEGEQKKSCFNKKRR